MRILLTISAALAMMLGFWISDAAAQTQPIPTSPLDRKEIERKRSGEVIGGKSLYEWINDLRDRDPSVRIRAIATLKFYGPTAKDALPLLIKSFNEKDTSSRVNAAITVGYIGVDPEHKEMVINGLIGLLNDRQAIVRYQAATTLSRLGMSMDKIGTDLNKAVPRLITLSKDTDSWEIRSAAATALGPCGWTEKGIDARALVALIHALSDPCAEVRYETLRSLILLGRPADPRDKALEEKALKLATNDKNEKVAIWAHVALMRINGVSENHLSAIAKYLKNPKADARLQACRAIATVGGEAKSRTPDLIEVLDDKDPGVVAWACIALGEMKESSAQAIPALRRLTAHADDGVKRAATDAMNRLGMPK